MKTAELRTWIEDALTRQDRDARERGEVPANVTVEEIVDAVWGRLPLEIRRQSSRSQVQASLTMLTLRHAYAAPTDGTTDAPSEQAALDS
ncbi:hypothetical protein SAMN05892883_1165 [Jatrophihabitans sp. GAS493]|uniref:hypothetical protein n=1 Tax=Jatrophihabitans sp. GAS493 TaxID=1907575 RepID=UPI000BB760C1|nr:hypothetical protein [Jatrophihabitans sp. GAS493]SOD71678.1 hypothetical protein SAMN05892883_1165 [Jatrophihabitans sp. GAS493]